VGVAKKTPSRFDREEVEEWWRGRVEESRGSSGVVDFYHVTELLVFFLSQ
jgi:hypothetical protein